MDVRDYLLSRDVAFDWFLHRPASTASRLARNVHVPGRAVAKGVVLKSGGGFYLAVLAATRRVDLLKFSQLVQSQVVQLADEDDVQAVFPDCERGAVPPFGRAFGIPTYVEVSLASTGMELVCVGNQRHEGVRLSYRDFETVENPIVAAFAEEVHRAPGSSARRIAG